MGNSVNIIGNSAFYECTGLTAVYYMGNIEQWCEITFNSQPLAYAHNLYINNELVTGLVIPEIIPEIKRSAFSGATCLTSVTIPNSVTSIGEYAFYNCSGLTTIVIGNSVTSIGAGAFYECSGINVLNYNAENCTINGGLFNVRNTLSKIIIGENVATIPDNAYLNCTLLDSIISLTENPPVIYASTFDSSLSHNIPVIVPCGTVEAYEDADFWYDFRHIQQSSDCGSSYTITVISANPNRGTVTGGGTYPAGTVISIEANAFDDFEFVSWNDGNTDNPRYLTVSGDAMFIASFDPAGIEENSMSGISIFPNPTNDILNITSSEEISEIEIVNTLGQVVCRTEVNRDNAVCDVEGLTSGVYVVRIHGTDTASICQKKFVKE